MSIINKTLVMSLALCGTALGCSRYEPTPPMVVPVSVDPAAAATHAELREARDAADSARAQARAATEARIQAERAAATIEARAAATAGTTPARSGPSVIGYGPSDATDRAEAAGYGLPVAVGGGLVVDQSFGRQRSAATSTASGSAPLTGLGSPGFPTAATGTAPGSAPLTGLGSPGFSTATDTSTRNTVNTSTPRRPDDPSRFTDGGRPPDAGSFDGGTRRDGGFADGGQRRPLSPTQQQALRSQQQQQQSQPSQLIQPQQAGSQQAGTGTQTAPANGM